MIGSPSTGTCRGLNPSSRQILGFHSPNITLFKLTNSSLRFNSLFLSSGHGTSSISCSFEGSRRTSKPRVNNDRRGHRHGTDGDAARGKGKGNKGKENVWSVDNERAKDMAQREKNKARRKMGKGRRVRKYKDSRIMVSGAMLMEVENVLQTEEPVIRPSWNTFSSSVCGIWKGVGAVFSPTTAEMEPIDVGSKQENLYDCYTLCRTDMMPVQSGETLIRRKINWVTLNPFGELKQAASGGTTKEEHKNGKAHSYLKEITDDRQAKHIVPTFESFDFSSSDVMEEDIMGMEPGLVYFEDGSYSRGPVDIPVGEANDANYYISPTYKFEQCLVKGCHKRLRIVHTIEFSDGGADVQILRVAVYEEQWVGPANIIENSEVELDVKPFSQRKRTRPTELTGSWKVLEMSATPIYGEDEMSTMTLEENSSRNGPPFVYLTVETLKKRRLPDNPASYFGEEEMMDMQDVSVLWLPGGVTGYVDISKDGTLCIGVGWYSDEGINLVMERDYGMDGKLKEVRMKTELKRRWTDGVDAA